MGSSSVIPPPPAGFVPEQTTPNLPPPPTGFVPETAAAKAPPVGEIRSDEPVGLAEKLSRWAENVSNDIKHGTDITGIGAFMKKMGAHGVYAGNAEAVGDYIASLPLGLLKATKGAGEIGQGKLWQGTKSVVGGALQASEIPSAFIAPEAGEAGAKIAAKGTEAATEAIKAGSKAITSKLRTGAVQEGAEGIQGMIRNTMDTLAEQEGIAKAPSKSIADTVEKTADQVYAKSKAQYRTLDEATNGRVQRFRDRLDNIRRKLDSLTGTEEDVQQEAKLLKAQGETEDAMHEAFEDARKAGVPPELVDEATANFKKSQALYDVDQAVKKSTTGMRPDVGSAKAAARNPEIVDPEKFFNRINNLHRSGRLEDALGADGADKLLDQANQAVVQFRRIKTTQKIAKGVGATLGLAGAAEGAKYVFKPASK